MKVQCSIYGSTLGAQLTGTNDGLAPALTESPLKALQGNQDLPSFFGILFEASCPTPAFPLYNCNIKEDSAGNVIGNDPAQDGADSDTFCLVHDYGSTDANDPTNDFEQIDTMDGSTFLITSRKVKGDPTQISDPIQVVNLPYANIDSGDGVKNFSSGSNILDLSSTRQTLLQAVTSVDLSPIWNGKQIPISGTPFPGSGGTCLMGYAYNRWDWTSRQPPNPDGGFYPIAGNGFGPNVVSSDPDNTVKSGILGLRYVRAQVQVRNVAGSPIEYNFLEVYGGKKITNGVVSLQALYRRGGSGVFAKEGDIADIPLPSITSYPVILGGWAITQGQTYILIGQSIDEYFNDRFIDPIIFI